MIGFLTGLFEVSDPGKEKREKQAQEREEKRKNLEELERLLSDTQPLLLASKGRRVELEKVRALLDKS